MATIWLASSRRLDRKSTRLNSSHGYISYAVFCLKQQVETDSALPRTAAGFIDRIEKVWRPFRAAIRDRGRAGLGERTSSGWTYKDLVAHAAGWMGQTVREMQTDEFSTGWTSETIQE